MQKVEDIKVNYKQCQDVLDCAEKRLQTNGLGVTTEGKTNLFISILSVVFLFSFRFSCNSEKCLFRNDNSWFKSKLNT
jgi:hypothetical protein